MKKVKTCRILLTALLLLVVVGIVVYRLMLSTPSEELSPKARVAAILEEGGCLSCHTANRGGISRVRHRTSYGGAQWRDAA